MISSKRPKKREKWQTITSSPNPGPDQAIAAAILENYNRYYGGEAGEFNSFSLLWKVKFKIQMHAVNQKIALIRSIYCSGVAISRLVYGPILKKKRFQPGTGKIQAYDLKVELTTVFYGGYLYPRY